MFNNNYYPYYNYGSSKPNLFNRFSNKTKFNWSNILNITQRTLNIINQTIPVIYQMKPIYNNAKTIFRVIGAIKEPSNNTIKKVEHPKKNTSITDTVNTNTNNSSNSNLPTFFI